MKNKNILSVVLVSLLALVGCNNSTNSSADSQSQTPINTQLDTKYTDSLKRATSSAFKGPYEGRTYSKGGVSEASFINGIDGDTARFEVDGQYINVRFLGIDTPESTGVIQAWGKKAAKFVISKLDEAKKNNVKIYLENEDQGYDQYDRGLAWVWIGDRLLNLEIIEAAYSRYTFVEGSHYDSVLWEASESTKAKGQRYLGGAKDPDFNYSTDLVNISLKEFNENFEKYEDGTNILVEGVITRKMGGFYLQDSEYDDILEISKYYGTYVYLGNGGNLAVLSDYEIGDRIIVKGQANTFNGSKQISAKSYIYEIEFVSSNNEVFETKLTGNEDLNYYDSMLVSYENVEITSRDATYDENGNYTVKGKTMSGQILQFRISTSMNNDMYSDELVVGNVVNLRGIVNKFNDTFQIKISSDNTGTLNDVVLVSK